MATIDNSNRPCRSCKFFNETKIDLGIMAVAGQCSKGILEDSGTKFSTYGSNSQVEGTTGCSSYNHDEDAW